MKVVERVQGLVREGFTLSDADTQALGAMNGEGSHSIELSPQLKQQLGIYGKKMTTEDVQRRLGAIEKKNQSQETESKTEPVVTQSKSTEPMKGETLLGGIAVQAEVDLRNSKEPLHQKVSDLDTLYEDAEVAQTELSDATRSIARQVGGEPLIPPSLKGRERTQEKIQSDYDGDASQITDLARSSVICENPQQVYKALGELESQFKVVRVKDQFEKPVNGYRDLMVNVEMSNGHIVEVQLLMRSVMEVKNGAWRKLYEE
jgi:hypothetical protein